MRPPANDPRRRPNHRLVKRYRSYTIEEAMKYWNVYYRANNLVGIVVGDFKPDEVKATIERYFGRLEAGKEMPPQVVTLEQKQSAEI
mgnify:CR=1 FL=1